MEPTSVIAVITVVIPFVTAGLKKIFRTDRWEEKRRKGWHALCPVLLGIVSSGAYALANGNDWVTSLAIGLGSGGAASSVRDIDRNLTQVVSVVLSLLKKRQPNNPA
jgi:hypothetical protein